jgi:hypothetical protein
MNARRPISQREARALRRRVKQLESELSNARRSYMPGVGGNLLVSIVASAESKAVVSINVAARLGFGVRAVANGDRVDFYTVKP